MIQFPTPEYGIRPSGESRDITPELIKIAFEVILEGYIRLEQKSPSHFKFEPGILAQMQEQKESLVHQYYQLAKAREMDQLAAFRFMRYDLRERLSR